jgi:hypothetical protein
VYKVVDYEVQGSGNLQQGPDRKVRSIANLLEEDNHTHTIGETGGGVPLSVMQPYIVCNHYVRIK